MPIICFEGASAVGKTTTTNALKSMCDAFIIPEVNELFARPQNEPADWYFERQVIRARMAQEQNPRHRLVILDGDPFQPLWYNWSYNYAGWQDLNFMEQFYRPRVQDGTIQFPDLYVIFSTDEVELRKRKENDRTRKRRSFETHLRMIEPQRRYFKAMHDFAPQRVLFREATTIEANVEFIQKNASAVSARGATESAWLFEKMIEWLRWNEA